MGPAALLLAKLPHIGGLPAPHSFHRTVEYRHGRPANGRASGSWSCVQNPGSAWIGVFYGITCELGFTRGAQREHRGRAEAGALLLRLTRLARLVGLVRYRLCTIAVSVGATVQPLTTRSAPEARRPRACARPRRVLRHSVRPPRGVHPPAARQGVGRRRRLCALRIASPPMAPYGLWVSAVSQWWSS